VVRMAGEIIPSGARAERVARQAQAPAAASTARSAADHGATRRRGATRCVNRQLAGDPARGPAHWVSKAALDVEAFGAADEQWWTGSGEPRFAALYRLMAPDSHLERMGENLSLAGGALEPPSNRPCRQFMAWHPHVDGGTQARAAVCLRRGLGHAAADNQKRSTAVFGIGAEIANPAPMVRHPPTRPAAELGLKGGPAAKVGWAAGEAANR